MTDKEGQSQHHFKHLDQVPKRLRNAARLCAHLTSLDIRPDTIVDVGCGYGFFLAEAAKAWSPSRILGIDGPWVETDRLQFTPSAFRVHDLHVPLRLEARFDLAVCLEVAEHVAEEHAGDLIGLLTGASDMVLFSAAIPGQGGKGHLNEQFPSYWCSHFAARGFVPVDILHSLVWTDEGLFNWFRQNLLIFVAEPRLASLPRLAASRTPPALLDRVHPQYFRRRTRQLREARAEIRRLEAETAALKARLASLQPSLG
jgi:SAM-dependent methyltransferase